jgi:hypothetical protein
MPSRECFVGGVTVEAGKRLLQQSWSEQGRAEPSSLRVESTNSSSNSCAGAGWGWGMSAAAVEEGHNAGEGSHEGEAVQDGGEREQGEAGGVPLTPLGSPFGRAIIQMVDHDVLVEIARSQERMYVAAPSLNHHTLPHISTWSIAQSLGFPSLQWPSYPRYDCCVFAVHSSCRRPLVCSCTLWVKPQSHTSAR